MNKINGQADIKHANPAKNAGAKSGYEERKPNPGEFPPEVIQAGVAAYDRWYSSGGQDDHSIAGLVAIIVSAVQKASRQDEGGIF